MEKKPKIRILTTISYALYFIIGFVISNIVFFERWLFKVWDRLTLDELIYHAKASLDGTNPDVIKDYIISSLIPASLIWVIFFGVILLCRKKNNIMKKILLTSSALTLIILMVVAGYEAEKNIGLISYCGQVVFSVDSDFIEANYVNPIDVELEFPEKKRNLIYIYLESMETTYADKESGGAFEDNTIKELTEIAMDNEDFSGDSSALNGGICLRGTTWTMGGMFGQTSGVPLKISLNGNQMQYQDSFFPDMITLGDILEDEGYNQELLIGSRAAFGGRELYFKEHGNYIIHDYDYAISNGLIPNDYFEFWGFEDEKLFEFAKNDLMHLASEEAPFNITILTVDTHFEDGYVCDLCDVEFGENQYANVMACSSRQVNGFIEWIKQQDFYKDTTVVLCGDHITMDSDFCVGVDEDYQRRTYTAIINGDASLSDKDSIREYSTLDMFPTTLAAIGVNIDGNRLGLGTNLYSDEQTIIEKYGLKLCNKELDRPSSFLEGYAKLEITDDIMKRISDACEVTIGESDAHKLVCYVDRGTVDQVVNFSLVKNVKLEIKDIDTNKEYKYDMEIYPAEDDPDGFICKIETDIPFSKKLNLSAKVYLSIDNYENYLICEQAGDELKPIEEKH